MAELSCTCDFSVCSLVCSQPWENHLVLGHSHPRCFWHVPGPRCTQGPYHCLGGPALLYPGGPTTTAEPLGCTQGPYHCNGALLLYPGGPTNSVRS
ncbi:unnamed protein product [Merluccius merluccius]